MTHYMTQCGEKQNKITHYKIMPRHTTNYTSLQLTQHIRSIHKSYSKTLQTSHYTHTHTIEQTEPRISTQHNTTTQPNSPQQSHNLPPQFITMRPISHTATQLPKTGKQVHAKSTSIHTVILRYIVYIICITLYCTGVEWRDYRLPISEKFG